MNDEFDPTAMIEALDEEGVSYLIIGGVAAGLYGSERNTYDLDIVPASDLGNARRLARALKRLDARSKGIDADKLSIELNAKSLAEGANFTLTTARGDLDVMSLTDGDRDWDHLRRRAVSLPLRDDLRVALVGKDDLIAMKRAAGRRQDIEDIVQITRGEYLARHARAHVLLSGRLRETARDDQAEEAADIATASYEHDVHFWVDPEEAAARYLRVEATLDGFARSHAEIWAATVTEKIEAQGVIEGEMEAVIQAP